MPTTTTATLLHLLLLLLLSFLSSTSTLHHRRILHQPLIPLDSSPPSQPPTPSPPTLPFTPSTPSTPNSPFFPSYPSPPAPPSPASFASFPANISSLSVPRPSKSNSTSSKLIIVAVAAVIAAIAVVSLAVFLHLRNRSTTHQTSCSKTQRSDNGSTSTVSFNQTAPINHHIPKLQRPSQTSSEFLYLGTLVNSHAPGGGTPFNGGGASSNNYNNASNARKLESPELRPLPPLNTQQRQNLRSNAEVVPSKDDESEEFYSPKGSINGSNGTGSASRRAFAAIEVENFNGSTSNSSSSSSSSAPGSGSGSPARSTSSVSPANNLSPSHSVPKSPDLIEIQTIASLPLQTVSPPEMRSSLLHESASPSPPSSSSPERDFRRSVESSPRNSDVSDQNVESPARSIPTPPEIGVLVLPESASPLPPSSPSQERYSRRSEESSPRNANVSDKHNTTVITTPPEMLPEFVSPLPMSSLSPEICLTTIEESSPRNSNVSDQNVESPVRSNSPSKHSNSVIPTSPEILLESTLPLPTSSLSPENYLRSEESSPRNSNVSDHYVESPVRISSPSQHNSTVIPTPPEMLLESASALPMSSFSPERFLRRSEGSSPRNSDVSDDNVESPVRISSPSQHNSTVIPTSPEILLESASALPASSSSPERYLRKSEESSPRNSNVSDQNVESPVRISSPSQHNSTVISTAPEMESLVIHGLASLSPLGSLSPERKSGKTEEPSPRISNASNHDVETPVTSPVQHNIITPLEMQDLVLSSPERYSRRSEESSLRISNVSDQDVASPVRISSPEQLKPPSPMNTSLPERYLIGSDEALARMLNDFDQTMESLVRNGSDPDQFMDSPLRNGNDSDQHMGSPMRNGNDSDQNMESPVRNGNDIDQNGESPVRNGNDSDQNVESPVRNGNDSDQNVESPVRNGNDTDQNMESPVTTGNDSVQNMECPVGSGSSVQHSTAVIPTPPPPPPAHLPAFLPSIPFPAPPVSVILPPRVSIPSPPPPPPLPLSKVWQSPKTPTPLAKKLVEPPTLINPLRPIAVGSPSLVSPIQLPSNDSHTLKNDGDEESPNKETKYSSESVDSNGDSPPKPKLKPLHWDKVRASSDREMVWDQLKCSSFKVNEEMIETLFVANTSKPNPKETNRWQVLPSPGQDNGNRVLDPKKAQNIAILLKALHVTVDEVCEGLLEGNADILGTELLESLLKMAPTKEEERKLKEHNDDSPVKLGPAERFLKAVVDIPHAFRRVEAMLYISNFESEVEYLKKSFSTLESACEELRTSRMFLKLLEAVLKTGNRMNVGTNRGDAQAFKLDTLLKLVDVKGADGKTTLLHFVVQEIIRSEGARLSGESSQQDASINDDAKCRKLGLQVVSALSSELSNVKKAAVMDAEMLSSEVSKLSKGIGNVREIVTLNEATSLEESVSHKFSDSMNSFIEKAEEEIFRIQAQENLALSLVKEITEYFHGNSAKEEAHPFRIFMVVRDFLTILDRVCKEVGMINERTIVTSAHKFPVPVNPMLQLPVPVNPFHKRQYTSSDDESLPLNI